MPGRIRGANLSAMAPARSRGAGSARPGAGAFLFDARDRLTRTDLWAWEEANRALDAGRPASAPTEVQDAIDRRALDAERNAAVVAAMREPAFYPDGSGQVEVCETHGSCVFLTADRAYKVRKAVVLPFLDYSSLTRRRALAEEELRLNRRLAGDLYVGIRGIAPIDGRLGLVAADDPRAVEYAVEMRRFDERDTLARALQDGLADRDTVDAVARRLAAFHAAAEPLHHEGGETPHLKRYLSESFATLAAAAPVLGRGRVLEAERFAISFLAARWPTIEPRAAQGLVREGHGDLRCEHVLIGSGDAEAVRVFDCIEFDPGLRELDVGADLSFLVMDLAAADRSDLARHLVESYRRAGGDPGDDALIAFHAATRAWVRAKVAWLRAGQPGATAQVRARALADADRLLALGERLAWHVRLPPVVIVCGPPASGKSHLADALGERCGRPILSSDRIRKELAGVEAEQPAGASRYSSNASLETYVELGRRASAAASMGEGALVDATFRHSAERAAFREASRLGNGLVMAIECRAPAGVLRARARVRDRVGRGSSDADATVVERLMGDWDPLDEVASGNHLVVRTDRNTDDVIDDIVALLDRRLERARGFSAPARAASVSDVRGQR
jgi:aminoglycoside phosphotransferase family enzyme/predicted kinase